MSTSVNVNELSSLHDRTRGYAEGRTGAAIAGLIPIGLVCLVVLGAIHLSSPVGSVEELGKDAGTFFVGP
jgi:hypothetical protein